MFERKKLSLLYRDRIPLATPVSKMLIIDKPIKLFLHRHISMVRLSPFGYDFLDRTSRTAVPPPPPPPPPPPLGSRCLRSQAEMLCLTSVSCKSKICVIRDRTQLKIYHGLSMHVIDVQDQNKICVQYFKLKSLRFTFFALSAGSQL